MNKVPDGSGGWDECYYIKDILGSVIAIVDEEGDVEKKDDDAIE